MTQVHLFLTQTQYRISTYRSETDPLSDNIMIRRRLQGKSKTINWGNTRSGTSCFSWFWSHFFFSILCFCTLENVKKCVWAVARLHTALKYFKISSEVLWFQIYNYSENNFAFVYICFCSIWKPVFNVGNHHKRALFSV